MSSASDVEIVVLGKGIGESVVVRIRGEWIIVDSFMVPDTDRSFRPAPLLYLRSRGVDCEREVVAVVLTHLHFDHSEGIDEVVEECRGARFYMPAAVRDEEWHEVLNVLRQGGRTGRKMTGIAKAFGTAWEEDRFQAVGASNLLLTSGPELFAVAPTVRAQNAVWKMADPLSPDAATVRENFTSIVLWLACGPAKAVLCADMDRHPHYGWQALLDEHAGRTWLRDAGFVKIAHHGSPYAHEPSMFASWTRSPVGVVAPNSGHRLPGQAMVTTLRSVCSSLFLAGPVRPSLLGTFAVTGGSTMVAVEAAWSQAAGTWVVPNPRGQRL